MKKGSNTVHIPPRGKPNWKHVARLNDDPDSLIRSSTAYSWWHKQIHPELFRKVGNKLFVDLDALYRLGVAGGQPQKKQKQHDPSVRLIFNEKGELKTWRIEAATQEDEQLVVAALGALGLSLGQQGQQGA